MSRFGTDFQFNYCTDGTNWISGTGITLDGPYMPQYPLEESRYSDRVVHRNLNGDAYVFQNYSKQQLTFRWTYLPETQANQIKRMVDANPFILFISNGTIYGTYIMDGMPDMSEVQFEYYDITLKLVES